jgi:hypothetical protein
MAILLSGDFHANAVQELKQITRLALEAKYGKELFGEIKYHIILGDGGFMWPGNEEKDAANYRALALRPFPILCIIGNHEPMLGRNDLEEVDIGIGETVLQVNKDPFTAYLKRGKIYTIEGYKFLALGGALSIDKASRKTGRSWWPKEYWLPEEKEAVMDLLKQEKNFDYVLAHTGPNRINRTLFARGEYNQKFNDEVAALNDTIDSMITCKQWFCGHWHKDMYHYDEDSERGYQYLYNKTGLLKNGEVTVK